jgi:transcriptional regulator with PAS, ATPase and Fis domain
VTLNVCAVADTIFEASMFGHTKGAFTGALRDMPGYLTEAHGGRSSSTR